jgi:hypothetical protein
VGDCALSWEDAWLTTPRPAISEGDHWVIDVDGVGIAQADNFDEIEATAVDLVTAVTRTAQADVHVQVRIV